MGHYVGNIEIPPEELELYDFNDDGIVNTIDAMIALQAASGKNTLASWPKAVKSVVTTKINMADPNNFISVEGTNMWGRHVKRSFSANITADIHPFLSSVYPIGCVYAHADSINPADLIGGTWQEITDTGMTGIYLWKRVA